MTKEELEKENAELKKQCDILNKSLITSTNNNIKRQEIIDKLKEKLEKENAEKENDLQYEMDCLRESKIELEKTFEKLLHELRDRDIVNWWLNGDGYHWEFNEDIRRKYGKEK